MAPLDNLTHILAVPWDSNDALRVGAEAIDTYRAECGLEDGE